MGVPASDGAEDRVNRPVGGSTSALASGIYEFGVFTSLLVTTQLLTKLSGFTAL